MATIPHGDVHLATSETDSYTQIVLMTGDTPPVVTTSEVSAQALPQWSVVARGMDGNLVLANNDSATQAIGITVNGVEAGGKVAVYRAGCFNPKALNWSAGFLTDEDKKTAFEATGTQIFLRAPLY